MEHDEQPESLPRKRMDELDALDPVPEINRAVAARALSASRGLLRRAAVESASGGEYRLYLG